MPVPGRLAVPLDQELAELAHHVDRGAALGAAVDEVEGAREGHEHAQEATLQDRVEIALERRAHRLAEPVREVRRHGACHRGDGEQKQRRQDDCNEAGEASGSVHVRVRDGRRSVRSLRIFAVRRKAEAPDMRDSVAGGRPNQPFRKRESVHKVLEGRAVSRTVTRMRHVSGKRRAHAFRERFP